MNPPSSTPSDEQADELDEKIIDIVKSLSMFSFHRGNWQKPIELHELLEYTSAIKALIALHTKEAVREFAERIYNLDIEGDDWRSIVAAELASSGQKEVE